MQRTADVAPDQEVRGHRPVSQPSPERQLTAPGSHSPALSTGSVLRLQRLAGNRAMSSALANRPAVPVQRCGPIPCDCGPEERAEKETALQRACDPSIATCAPTDAAEGDTSHLDSEIAATLAEIDARSSESAPVSRQPSLQASARPLTATLRPDQRYAFAPTVGFVSSTGYSAPRAVLASDALVAEGSAAAESLATATGLRTAPVVVMEGSALARSLIAAGETILAVEAGGAGEAEAASGPPGWIIGAVALLAAGASIGVGYLLLRDQPQATAQPQTAPRSQATPQTQTRRNPNQTCENSVLDALQAEKDRICNAIPGSSCSPSKVSPKRLARIPCSEIRLRIQAMRACMAIRQRIQDECFGGAPDKAHQDAMDFLQNGINHCLVLEAQNCAPGHPMSGL